VLINTVISGNSVDGGSDNHGGGIYNYNSPLALVNVSISGNKAGRHGGGIYNNNSVQSVRLINVSISGNYANNEGGGMYIDGSAGAQVQNSIIWKNKAVVSHSNIYANASTSVNNSIVEDGFGSNLDDNPYFLVEIDPDDAPKSGGNYRLNSGSLAIDKGANSAYLEDADAVEGVLGNPPLSAEARAAINAALLTDLDGSAPRIKGSKIDMGAYEK
jgi:hypothetical protein